MKKPDQSLLVGMFLVAGLPILAQAGPKAPTPGAPQAAAPAGPRSPQLAVVRETRDQWEEGCLDKFTGRPHLAWVRVVLGVPDRRSVAVSGVITDSVNLFQGTLWGLRKGAPTLDDGQATGTPGGLQLCSSTSGKEWQGVGRLDPREGSFESDLPWILIPLEDGRFFDVHRNPLRLGDRESLFAVYRLQDGKPALQLEEVCDMGLGGTRFEGLPIGKSPLSALIGQGLFGFLAAEIRALGPIRTPSHLCFIHASSGLVWVFRTRDGALKGLHPLSAAVLKLLDQPERI